MNYTQFLQSIKHEQLEEISITEEATKDLYEGISHSKIAKIIKEHHDVRITDTLIESYVNLASTNTFSVDPVVYELRTINRLDRLIEGKINYTLNDGSIVAINEQTQELINKVLSDQIEIISYMCESKDNFLKVINQIGE
jgi:hypothetical protein